MRAKKAKKPSQSIRYLLFVDRTLQKISLRKIRERVTKAQRRPSRAHAIGPRPRHRQTGILPLATSPRAIVLGVTGVLIAAALLAARQPLSQGEKTAAAVPPEMASLADQAPAPIPSLSQAEKTAAAVPPKMASVEREGNTTPMPTPAAAISKPRAPEVTRITRTPMPVIEPAKTESVSVKPEIPVREVSSTSVIAPASEPIESTSPTASTITGCVKSNDGAFWLTDTSGTDAPKSRSWKSGFFKKRSVSVELQDPSRTLRLDTYVGQRVAATGTLVDREMRARSLHKLSGGCD